MKRTTVRGFSLPSRCGREDGAGGGDHCAVALVVLFIRWPPGVMRASSAPNVSVSWQWSSPHDAWTLMSARPRARRVDLRHGPIDLATVDDELERVELLVLLHQL